MIPPKLVLVFALFTSLAPVQYISAKSQSRKPFDEAARKRDHQAFREQIDRTLAEIDRKMRLLEPTAGLGTAAEQAQKRKILSELQESRREINEELAELDREVADSDWEEDKRDLQEDVNELQYKVNRGL